MTIKKILMAAAFYLFWMGGVRADTLPAGFSDLSKIRSIDIQDNWMGLTEFGPVGRHFVLKPAGDRFEGKAEFSLGGGPMKTTREAPIAIPRETVQGFLDLLSKSPLEKGTYKPKITHTDDYPSLRIELESGANKFAFFSDSQDDGAIPWGASLGGVSYIVNSRNPFDALVKFKPYLKEDVLAKFMEEIRKRNSDSRP
jgi:hypothetical protein